MCMLAWVSRRLEAILKVNGGRFDLKQWISVAFYNVKYFQWNIFFILHSLTSKQPLSSVPMILDHPVHSDLKVLGPCTDYSYKFMIFDCWKKCMKVIENSPILLYSCLNMLDITPNEISALISRWFWKYQPLKLVVFNFT